MEPHVGRQLKCNIYNKPRKTSRLFLAKQTYLDKAGIIGSKFDLRSYFSRGLASFLGGSGWRDGGAGLLCGGGDLRDGGFVTRLGDEVGGRADGRAGDAARRHRGGGRLNPRGRPVLNLIRRQRQAPRDQHKHGR